MSKIGIITDSTVIFKEEELNSIKDYVKIVNLQVIHGTISYQDNVNITHADVFELLNNGETVTTSQPTMVQFHETYEKFVSEGFTDVLVLHLPEKVSGTAKTSKMIGEEYDSLNIHYVDTCTSIGALKYLILDTIEEIKKGISVPEVFEFVKSKHDRFRIEFIPNNLKQLAKSGRVSNGAVLVTQLLSIKLLMELKPEGSIALREKIRSEKKAYKTLLNNAKEEIIKFNNFSDCRITVIHLGVPETAQKFKEELESEFLGLHVDIEPIITSFAVHLGVGSVGICCERYM